MAKVAAWRLPASMRAVTAIACIPAGLFLIEFPYNQGLPSIDATLIWVNLFIVGLAFGVVFFACQRSRVSMAMFLAACFALGVASYYVAQFKGQAIMPSDVASLRTAGAVMGGYSYAIDARIAVSLIVVEVFACVCALLPKRGARRMESVIVNCLCLALVAAYGSCWWLNADIEKDYEVGVNAWGTLSSYQSQGFLLSFLDCVQQLVPDAPEEYSHEEAERILANALNRESARPQLTEASYFPGPDSRPSIIVIMNESFADYTMYDAIDDSYTGPTAFRAIAEDSLVYGDTYVSAMSGGTCNSEFEFLTGSTMGMLGTGVYPYTFYDLGEVDSIVKSLKHNGYLATAIHPSHAYNWRRDRVYGQLGFDKFISEERFEEAETRREYVTDAETYKVVLEQLASSDDVQFIFDVTIANHGGYGSGSIPERDKVSALVNGEANEELDEYLSCIAYSDAEFAEFVRSLESLDRPVVVCMFGDHQPYFADDLAMQSYGMTVSEMDIAQRQARYTTPYLIWTNDAALRTRTGKGRRLDTSLNYLGAILMETAGVPMDDYFSFLLATRESLPAINMNGFMDEDGTWRWFVESGLPATKNAKSELRIIQYDNLFGKKSG